MKLGIVSTLVAASTVAALTAETAVNVCYYTNWAQYRPGNGKFKPVNIDPNLCTHINYAFAFVTDDGTDLVPYEWNDVTDWGTSMYAEVNKMKEQNEELKVLLSIGGWTHGTGGFTVSAQSDYSRKLFAANSLEFIQKYGFDGIDIDWEYPGFTNHPTKPGTAADVSNHVYLLEELKSVFAPAGLMVTAAVGAPPSRVDESYPDTARMCAALDMVHLMTYDFHGGWEDVIGHHSPFTSDGNHPNDSENNWNVKSSVDYWIEKGCPAHKLTLGLGAYGRVFKATTDKVERLSPGTTKGVRGTYTREDGYMSYYELCQWDTHVDAATQSAVAINGQMWAGLETVDSANVKLDFLIERGMAGLMWWSLDLDDFDGTFCGQGKYPLISGVWRNLQSKLHDAPEVSTTIPETTSSADIGTNSTPDTLATAPTTSITTHPTTPSVTTTKTSVHPSIETITEYCNRLGDGLWIHPLSCGSYVQCAHEGKVAVERKCGAGLLWNSVASYCDWEAIVLSCEKCDCSATTPPTEGTTARSTTVKSESTSKATTSDNMTPISENSQTVCLNLQNGFVEYFGDCKKFIQCDNGRSFVKTCPSGTVWNNALRHCDWPYNVPTCSN